MGFEGEGMGVVWSFAHGCATFSYFGNYVVVGGLLLSALLPVDCRAAAVDNSPDKEVDAQTYRTPYRLEPIAPVQLNNVWAPNASSVPAPDAAALAVGAYFKPYYQLNYTPPGDVVPRTGSDRNELTFNLSAMQAAGKVSQRLTSGVNPYQLQATTTSEVRVYFIESTYTQGNDCRDIGYRGALGYVDVTNSAGNVNPLTDYDVNKKSLIFPFIDNAITQTDVAQSGNPSMDGRRTYDKNPGNYDYEKDQPLLPFDYVDLGTIGVGDVKEFFYLQDIAKKSLDSAKLTSSPSKSINPIYFTNPSRNVVEPQGSSFQHFQFYDVPEYGTLVALESTPYTSGSNKNFYDLFFLIQLRPVPEPQVYMTIGVLLLVAFAIKRRRVSVSI